jgi:hypothetical protein
MKVQRYYIDYDLGEMISSRDGEYVLTEDVMVMAESLLIGVGIVPELATKMVSEIFTND